MKTESRAISILIIILLSLSQTNIATANNYDVPVIAPTGPISLVSVTSTGVLSNTESRHPKISGDGRYVVFESAADNLVPGDTNNCLDVFLHDSQTGTTKRVSVSSDGTQGNSPSHSADISYNGRYLVFQSAASNLVIGDSNSYDDIFLHDTLTSETKRVSVASDGSQANSSSSSSSDSIPSISSDGRYIAFASHANNLVPGDTNSNTDVFVHDTFTGQTSLVSIASDGSQGDNYSGNPSISDDGRYTAFYSQASNFISGDSIGSYDVFVHDRQTGNTICISKNSSGVLANDHSFQPSISGNGRFVAYMSWATNLVDGDTNGVNDIFLYDSLIDQISRVSVNDDGIQGNYYSSSPDISTNGRYVAFHSLSNNFDQDTWDNNGYLDIFVRDVLLDTTRRISIANDGNEGNDNTYNPSISDSGNQVAFETLASNLDSNDTNGVRDIALFENNMSPDIEIRQESYFDGWDDFGGVLPPSQVSVQGCVKNIGDIEVTGNVYLYVDGDWKDTVAFPDSGYLAINETECVYLNWDLGSAEGSTSEMIELFADIDVYDDIDYSDNSYYDEIDIYWSDFPLDRDGYKFDNGGYTIELFLDDLADLRINDLSSSGIARLVTYGLFVGPSEWKGRCFGMSSTSILYRDHPGLMPTGYSITHDIDEVDALPIIRKYQRNQILLGTKSLPNNFSPSVQLYKLINQMDKDSPIPVQLLLQTEGERGGHAVVAHKVINTQNNDFIFLYENEDHDQHHQININDGSFDYYGFDQFYPNETRLLPDDWIKEKAQDLADKFLLSNDWISLFVGSPVEVIVTNSSGDRIGTLSSTEINEIPGAEMWWVDGKYYFTLPNTDTYTVTATGDISTVVQGTDTATSNTMDLGYASPTSDGQIMAVSFTDVPVTDASPHITVIGDDPDNVDPIHLPGGGTHPADEIEVTNPETFPDVQSTHWAWNYVEGIYEAGLTSGYPDGTYLPENPVNRAEMAIFLQKGMRGASFTPPAIDGSHPFSDISGHWAESWIEELFDSGMTGGYPDGTYRPFNKVTRAEMAIFLLKARHGNSYSPPAASGGAFSDVEGHWAEAWIEQLAAEGITSGYPDGTFRPDRTVTRAEMAVFLVNAFGLPTL